MKVRQFADGAVILLDETELDLLQGIKEAPLLAAGSPAVGEALQFIRVLLFHIRAREVR